MFCLFHRRHRHPSHDFPLSFISSATTDTFNVIDRLWFIYRIRFMPSFIWTKNKRKILSEFKQKESKARDECMAKIENG